MNNMKQYRDEIQELHRIYTQDCLQIDYLFAIEPWIEHDQKLIADCKEAARSIYLHAVKQVIIAIR